ncbi:hypothetical protein DSECCO2_573850 [anaerobic digester metagenome]
MRGVVGAEEQRLGDRVHPFGNRPPHRLAHPGRAGFAGEEGVKIGDQLAEAGDERALAAPVDPLDGDQHGCPLRTHSSGTVPRWTAVAMIAPSNPASSRRRMSSVPATPPP